MSKDQKPTDRKRDSVHDEKRTPLDGMKEQQHTDDIPMEDLKIDELKDRDGAGYQKTSQSERKWEEKDNKKHDDID
ncbi:hypothetical protein ACFFJI_02140 [Allobacillus sp. GCM10007491]|uniref:Uncharacterized protein n=1 Tax=Allobacillus saliphilus TaxID=2912308 RepID=A0A941CVT7_9BACI|nr:hypothetical protein [Allobacillus saliphilus]MBR7554061.1 hypothetical protein [Allobacillus saliphilus]